MHYSTGALLLAISIVLDYALKAFLGIASPSDWIGHNTQDGNICSRQAYCYA